MPKKARKKGKATQTVRLKKANEMLHAVWDLLEPEDLSEARWGDLRNVITSVIAKCNR